MNNVVPLKTLRRVRRLDEFRVAPRPRRKSRVVTVPTLIASILAALIVGHGIK